jgi:hypothetical protein
MSIAFRAADTGTGPLTWGQLAIWEAIGRTAPDDHYFNFGRILKVPGVRTPAEVDAALARMAARVDTQNEDDPLYRPMRGNEATSLAFQAARALIFEGVAQPNGYTEPLLHAFRRRVKGDEGERVRACRGGAQTPNCHVAVTEPPENPYSRER